jgi:hypothetical protein
MRVILERPAPGVQDTEEAQAITAEVLGIRCQQSQRHAGSLEERGVDYALWPRASSHSVAGSVKVTRK